MKTKELLIGLAFGLLIGAAADHSLSRRFILILQNNTMVKMNERTGETWALVDAKTGWLKLDKSN